MSDTYTGFSTTPIKANLFVNGNIVATTPYSATWFKAGDAIRIELAGYKTISFILTADRIGKSNYYLLETDAAAPVTAKTYGDVQIRSSPTNARIFIGGSDTGKNTPFLITLETGLRTITLKKAGYQDLTWTEVITSMSKILPLRFLVQVPIPVPTPAPVPEPTPTPTASPFRQKWDEIVADVKAGNWLRVLTGVLVLPTLRTIPGDEKVLAGTVPISPAAGLEAYLIASATANTAKAVTKGTTYFTGFEKIRRAFSSSAGLSKLWWAIAGIVGLDGIMTWLASDNIITGSSFTLNKLSAAAIDETITKEDAIAQLDKVQKWKDYATNFVRTSTIVNPLLWLFRGILLTNAEKGQDDINLERGKIEAIIRVKEIPEVVKAVVSDILDGDTIVVRRKGEGEALPEYLKTGHARIRINGINAPEKSPKGEITCTGIDLYKVEPKWADESRNALLPLNEKEVTLNIDPENSIDSYGRVIAKVISAGVDVGLSQIKNGLACYYFVEKNKYVDENLYKQAAATARENKIGMWEGVARQDFKIKITSEPSNAKVYIDGTYTKHLTPSDEEELADVMELLDEGKHIIKVEKALITKEREIDIEFKDMGIINFILEEAAKEEVPEIGELPVVPPVIVPGVLPTLREFYNEIGTYVFEGKRLTRIEWEALGLKYGLTQLGEIPATAKTVQDLYLILGSYVIGRAVLTEKEWVELETMLEEGV